MAITTGPQEQVYSDLANTMDFLDAMEIGTNSNRIPKSGVTSFLEENQTSLMLGAGVLIALLLIGGRR